jgi:hypothetical protein
MWSVARRHRTAQEWQAFRAYVEHDHPSHYAELYRTKVANPTQGGPFGFLIRDVPIYKATTGKGEWHDYLRLPEIVEDVCMAFRESFDQDLTADYLAASRPCIVKFRATGGELDAAAALLYLCHSIQDVDLAFDLGVTYDAGGARIPSITFWMWIGPSCRGRGCTQQHF